MHTHIIRAIVICCTAIIFTACGGSQSISTDNINSLAESVIDDLRLSDTQSLTLEACIDRLKSINEPTRVRQGRVVPSNIVLFIDFATDYIDPRDYPVEAICSESGYGIYLGTGQFELPVDADIWVIDRDQ